MSKLTQVAESMQNVLTDVAEKAGQETGFVKRKSKLTAELFVQTLVFGWMANPSASIEELTQTGAALGVDISPQGLDQRFTESAAECLKQVLEEAVCQAIASEPAAIPILERFSGFYIFDASTVSLPQELKQIWASCGGSASAAAVKLDVGLEFKTGQLSGPFLQAGRASDMDAPTQKIALPAGSLRIGDLAYFGLEQFAKLSADGVYWLSRLQSHTGMYDEAGNYSQVVEFLQQQKVDTVEIPILLGFKDRLPCRLLAVRVPPQVVEQRRRRLRQRMAKDARNGSTPSKKQLAFTEWTVFVTNAPANLLSLDEALIIARARWQIELLFKLWKSHGKIDEWRTKKPWRILCEVYAKLLAMLVQHWILIISCWRYPNRSLFKAIQTVQKMALHLASVFGHIRQLCAAIATIERCLTKGCRINKRKAKPNTYQLLLDLAELNFS